MSFGHYDGKAAEKRKAALSKSQLRSRYNITPDAVREDSLRNQAMSSGGGFNLSMRDRGAIEVDAPKPKDYFVPWAPGVALKRSVYDSAMRAHAERQAAERRRKEAVAQAEWQKKEDEVRARREQWRIESDREALEKHNAEQAERTERALLATAITDVLDGCTPEEINEVARRVKEQGVERLPSMYRFELDRLRSEKEGK